MKKLIIFLLACTVGVAFGQSESVISEIDGLIKEEKYAKAKSILDKQIKKYPENDELLVKRGICYYKLKKLQDSYNDLTLAIKLNPESADAYFNRAQLFLTTKEPVEAVNDLNMAHRFVKSDSLKIEILLDRASARFELRQVEGTITDASKVLELDSNNLAALNLVAMTYNHNHDNEKALEYLYRIASIDSSTYYVPMNIGFVLIDMEEYDKAIEWLNKAIAIDASQSYTFNNRGYAKYKLGQITEALDDVNHSIDMNDHNCYAYRNRALILIYMDDIDNACLDLHKSLDYGFAEKYGNEVNDLIIEHCRKD